jgi:hypothetical protein
MTLKVVVAIKNIIFRFMVGFNIGCAPQSVTLYAEFLPTKQGGGEYFVAPGCLLLFFIFLLSLSLLYISYLSVAHT